MGEGTMKIITLNVSFEGEIADYFIKQGVRTDMTAEELLTALILIIFENDLVDEILGETTI